MLPAMIQPHPFSRVLALWALLAILAACGEDSHDGVSPPPQFDGGADVADASMFNDVASGFDAVTKDIGDDAAPADISTDTSEPEIACTVGARAGVCLNVSECDGDREPVPGHCPGPAEIQCCVAHISTGDQCNPDASYEQMPRPNEGLDESDGVDGCPAGMARVATFCVDRFEAALVEVFADGSQRSWSPYFNPGARRVRAISAAGAVPQGYISGTQAAAACAEAGKRLCTDTEWLRACQGPGTSTYPHGEVRQPGACNDARAVHPVIEYFGTTEDYIWSHLGNACINQQDDTLTLTGARSECVTAEGLFDMMGNVHEWTADPTGTFRGGFYVDTFRNGEGCLYRTGAHNSSHWDYSTGFRCCADGA